MDEFSAEFQNRRLFDLDAGEGRHAGAGKKEFVRLYSRSYRSIYAYMRALVGNQSDVDDCMQELSILLLEKYDSSIPDADFFRWARGFARNVVRSHHRRLRRQALVLDDDLIHRIAQVQLGASEYLELRREQLHNCLLELSGSDRELVAMFYREQSSVKEIAVARRRQERAVQRALRRIRLALAKCIDRHLRLME